MSMMKHEMLAAEIRKRKMSAGGEVEESPDDGFLEADEAPADMGEEHYPDPDLKESDDAVEAGAMPVDKKKAIASAMEKIRLRHYHSK